MDKKWFVLKIIIDKKAREAVTAILEKNKALGIVIDNSEVEENNLVPEYVSFPNKILIKSYFAEIPKINNILNKITVLQYTDLLSGNFYYDFSILENKNWSKSWQKFFTPTKIGDSFLVCPSWHDCPKTSRKIISLDPGQAFGVGTHETTRLAVFFLEELLLRKNISIKNCLDVGTGSGILSIITAKLGVKNILGIDISEVAVKTARKNIKINDVYDKINILEKNIKDNTDNNFQLVVSNLLPQLLLDLSSYLVDSISQNGYLIISGITGEKEKEIKNIFLNRSLKIREKSREGDWISFLMQKE